MRILLVSKLRVSTNGFAIGYSSELSKRIAKEHEVHIIPTNLFLPSVDIQNAIIHDPLINSKLFSRHRTLAKVLDLLKVYINTKYVERVKEKFKIDIVHSNGETDTWKCDVATIHYCHRIWDEVIKNNTIQRIQNMCNPLRKYRLYIERKLIDRAKKIIAISNREREGTIKQYGIPEDKVVTIHLTVDAKKFKPDSEKRSKVRERYGIDEDTIVLMFAGADFKRKGLANLIKALPMIKENVKVFVVGSGKSKYYKNLAMKLNVLDKIIFTGRVRDIAEYYSASDIFVFPTMYEPFGFVIAEAMASGLAVVASRTAGAAEFIRDGFNGLLIDDPTNPMEIAEKVSSLIKDESFRISLGRNARKIFERYTWDDVAKRTLEVYEEVMKR